MYRAKPNIAPYATPGALVTDGTNTWTILQAPLTWPRLWVIANTDGVQTVDLRDPAWSFA